MFSVSLSLSNVMKTLLRETALAASFGLLTNLTFVTYKQLELNAADVSSLFQSSHEDEEEKIRKSMVDFNSRYHMFEEAVDAIGRQQDYTDEMFEALEAKLSLVEAELDQLMTDVTQYKADCEMIESTIRSLEKKRCEVNDLQAPLQSKAASILAIINQTCDEAEMEAEEIEYQAEHESRFREQLNSAIFELNRKVEQQNIMMQLQLEDRHALAEKLGNKLDIEMLARSLEDVDRIISKYELHVPSAENLKSSIAHMPLQIAAQQKTFAYDERNSNGEKCASMQDLNVIIRSELRGEKNRLSSRQDFASITGATILSHSKTYVPAFLDHIDTTSVASIIKSLRDMNRNIQGQPREALTDGTDLGSCWAMEGKRGYLTVKLVASAYITSVSIEHVRANASPDVRSAPRMFTVFGHREGSSLEEIKENYHASDKLVEGRYNVYSKYIVQTFPVKDLHTSAQSVYSAVTLEINDNHGLANFTCLYRFRVHGFPVVE